MQEPVAMKEETSAPVDVVQQPSARPAADASVDEKKIVDGTEESTASPALSASSVEPSASLTIAKSGPNVAAEPDASGSMAGAGAVNPSIALSSAMLWRNKNVSCEGIRSFEAARKAKIDAFQDHDRLYWQSFEAEIMRARDENQRLLRFFALRIQADLAYADSLRKIRAVLDRPSQSLAPPSSAAGAKTKPLELSGIASSCAKALTTLGEVQQQLSEKLVQFTTVVKRDVVTRPLDEMAQNYEERSTTMLTEGNRLDGLLQDALKYVGEAFTRYDAIYRDMEAEKRMHGRNDGRHGESTASSTTRQDLWLAEIAYCIAVHRLKQRRVEYVKGMSNLFQQYKSMEVLRESVIQTALDTYCRKQKLIYDELAGAMSEPMSAAQRIDPDRDLLNSIRRIPRSYTAAALTSEATEKELFEKLRSPLTSPLLVRCGFLKHQVSSSLFKSWKDVLCAVTQDHFLHLIDLKDSASQSIVESSEALLEAIVTSEQPLEVSCVSINLANCKVDMLANNSTPTFEITEVIQPSGLLGSMFRLDTRRTFAFQCVNQTDLLDWVVATKRFTS